MDIAVCGAGHEEEAVGKLASSSIRLILEMVVTGHHPRVLLETLSLCCLTHIPRWSFRRRLQLCTSQAAGCASSLFLKACDVARRRDGAVLLSERSAGRVEETIQQQRG